MATGALMRTTLHNVATISAFIMTISFQLWKLDMFPATPDIIQILCRFFSFGNQMLFRVPKALVFLYRSNEKDRAFPPKELLIGAKGVKTQPSRRRLARLWLSRWEKVATISTCGEYLN